MTAQANIKAVFFDLDNTLYDHRRACREALAALYRRHDVVAAAFSLDDFQRTFAEINQRLWLGLATAEIDVTTLRAQRFAELFAAVGAPCDDAAALGQEYLDIYLTFSYPLPGAEETLAALAPLLPLGLLTNGFTDIQRAKISRLGWERYFRWLVVAEEVGAFKPAAAIYEKMCALAALAPSEVLYVGDSPVEDVVAAAEVGLRTVWLRRDGPEMARWAGAAAAAAAYEVADVRDVAPLVKALISAS